MQRSSILELRLHPVCDDIVKLVLCGDVIQSGHQPFDGQV